MKTFALAGSRCTLAPALFAALSILPQSKFAAAKTNPRSLGGEEYVGKLKPELVADEDETEQVIFKPLRDASKFKFAAPPAATDKLTAARLYHPGMDKSSILAILVEPEDDTPYLYADLNLDNSFTEDERFTLTRGEDSNPYILSATLKLPLNNSLFKTFPIVVQYFKNVRWSGMQEGERTIKQTKAAYATGSVTIAGKPTLVQYGFNAKSKKVSATNGRLGVDCAGDGKIDMNRFSPEAADARGETVVFRVGDKYVSTKRVDIDKKQIVMREHSASDYKRIELRVGDEMPDFKFTDFEGKNGSFRSFAANMCCLISGACGVRRAAKSCRICAPRTRASRRAASRF